MLKKNQRRSALALSIPSKGPIRRSSSFSVYRIPWKGVTPWSGSNNKINKLISSYFDAGSLELFRTQKLNIWAKIGVTSNLEVENIQFLHIDPKRCGKRPLNEKGKPFVGLSSECNPVAWICLSTKAAAHPLHRWPKQNDFLGEICGASGPSVRRPQLKSPSVALWGPSIASYGGVV